MNIGAKIKALRKKRGITQERLAEYLNISAQAVSKWENGTALPDISYVPKLVSFFGVSADELFSLNKNMTDKRILYYREEFYRLRKLFDTDGCIRLMEQALSEIPANYEFMLDLAHMLAQKDERPRDAGRIISLCERILDDCTDDNLRYPAMELLCVYYPAAGRKDEALAMLDNLPDMLIEKAFWKERVLDGDERIAQKQKNLIFLIDHVVSCLIYLSSNGFMGMSLSIEEKLRFAEAALQIYSTVFYKGHKSPNSGTFRHIYERMSELYCRLNDSEKAINCLSKAAEAAKCYDDTIDSTDNYYPIFISSVKCRHDERYYLDTVRLLQLMDKRKSFDAIRDTSGFNAIRSELMRYIEASEFNKKQE